MEVVHIFNVQGNYEVLSTSCSFENITTLDEGAILHTDYESYGWTEFNFNNFTNIRADNGSIIAIFALNHILFNNCKFYKNVAVNWGSIGIF